MSRGMLVVADLAAVVAGVVLAFAAGALFGVDPPAGTSAGVLLALGLAIAAPVVLAAEASSCAGGTMRSVICSQSMQQARAVIARCGRPRVPLIDVNTSGHHALAAGA